MKLLDTKDKRQHFLVQLWVILFPGCKRSRCKSNRPCQTISILIGDNCAHTVGWRICSQWQGKLWIIMSQHFVGGQWIFGWQKSFLAGLSPPPRTTLTQQPVQWVDQGRQVRNELCIVIQQTQKWNEAPEHYGEVELLEMQQAIVE